MKLKENLEKLISFYAEKLSLFTFITDVTVSDLNSHLLSAFMKVVNAAFQAHLIKELKRNTSSYFEMEILKNKLINSVH